LIKLVYNKSFKKSKLDLE